MQGQKNEPGMCGRFSLTESIEAICKRFNAIFEGEEWHPRYNIAPAQKILTVIADRTAARRLVPMHWGLIPGWSKDKKIGYKMINARAETLQEKASFKNPLKRQRCLIPADGFYEWKKEDSGKKPLRVVMKKGGLFAMAGLWDRWSDKEDGKIVHSFTIVTTQSNSLLKAIHDRMPAILLPEEEHLWLDPALENVEMLEKLLKPYSSADMDFYEVPPVVNTWKNDVEECIKRAG
jgi:putative SOS response-associated peptidase YedK